MEPSFLLEILSVPEIKVLMPSSEELPWCFGSSDRFFYFPQEYRQTFNPFVEESCGHQAEPAVNFIKTDGIAQRH